MRLGQVLNSIESWRKLSAISMKPKLAYQLLKYTELVSAEHAIVEKQKAALLYEVTGVEVGQPVSIKPDDPKMEEFAPKFNEIMLTESDLVQVDMDFEEVVNAVDEKDESLSISDLATLEPFFKSGNEPTEAEEK